MKSFVGFEFWAVDGVPVVELIGKGAVALDKDEPRPASVPKRGGGDSELLTKEGFEARFPDALGKLSKAALYKAREAAAS